MSNFVTPDLRVDALIEEGPEQILKDMDLTVSPGEIHAIMGPNGSEKSTLAYTIAGHPKYEIISGFVALDGVGLTNPVVDERARQDLFLAMQYPVKASGVSVANFLCTAKIVLDGKTPKIHTWVKDIENILDCVNLDSSSSTCSVNEGFSDDEKRRHEIAQPELLNPRVAILDEIDFGLNIDVLHVASEGVNHYSVQGDRVVMFIAYYARIPYYIDPTFVHAFVDGRVADQGGRELADRLETESYEAYVEVVAVNV